MTLSWGVIVGYLASVKSFECAVSCNMCLDDDDEADFSSSETESSDSDVLQFDDVEHPLESGQDHSISAVRNAITLYLSEHFVCEGNTFRPLM